MNIRTSRRRTVVGVLLLVLAVGLPAAASHTFTDVDDSNVFHEDIAWLEEAGVTKGCNPPENTEFCPDESVTRAQMAAFMRRLATNGVVDAGSLGGHTAEEILAGVEGPRGPQGPEGPRGPAGPVEEPEPYREVGTPGEPDFFDWENSGGNSSTAAFYKDPMGVVHLKGQVEPVGAVPGNVIFTLPEGYRPAQILSLPTTVLDDPGGSAGTVVIQPDGSVLIGDGRREPLTLDGMTFRAD